jgi:ssRNA-specific RNase YbeY (16S rRNA maturation enzyme)
MINVITSSRYKIHKKKLKTYTESLMHQYGIAEDKVVNIVFIGRRKMRTIANEYKHEDVALPVLAFPYKGEQLGEEALFGEIILCYPQVVLLAAEREKTLDTMIEQLVDHGFKNLLK